MFIQVNNAGVAYDLKGDVIKYETAKDMIDTNYYGAKNVTEAMLPLLRPSPAAARIVNVSSGAGLYAVSGSVLNSLPSARMLAIYASSKLIA